MIKARNTLKGKLNTSIVREYPELENLEVMPSIEEQNFKSNKYGYDEVTVKGVTADIDANIQPEYIKEGVSILGVDGGYKGVDTSDATAVAEDVLQDKTFYANNQKIVGAMQEYDGSYSGNTSEPVVITDASYLFYGGARLEQMKELIELFENVVDMNNMFCSCDEKTLDLSGLDTSNVTSMKNMFNSCPNIETLNLSGFDMSKVINVSTMFSYCGSGGKFTDLKSFKNLGKGYTNQKNNYSSYKLDLSPCKNLSHESLIDVITNGLYDLNLTYDVANGGTLYRQSFVLGATNLAKLTEEEIAIATNKGWDVS